MQQIRCRRRPAASARRDEEDFELAAARPQNRQANSCADDAARVLAAIDSALAD